MRNRPALREHKNQRGQTILLVALALVSLLGMAALAIDVVTLYVARSEVQRAADAMALAAAKAVADSGFTTIPTTDPHYIDGTAQIQAQNMAIAVVNAMVNTNPPVNLVAGAPPVLASAPIVDLAHQGDARITVALRSVTLPTFFSKIWGRGSAIVTASAAAEAYNPANIGPFTPIAPTSLKPWLVANVDPVTAAPIVNIATGNVENGITGKTFNLTADCAIAGVTCTPPDNPPGVPGSSTVLNPQVEYVPLQVVASTKNVCPACAGATDYEQSIECADVNTYVTPTCGGGVPNAVWDNTVTPAGGSGLSAAGGECLIHASTSGAGKGQDLLIEPFVPFSSPVQIKAQSGAQNGNFVTTSNSVVTIPILDNSASIPVTGGAVTVVGFIQAFVNQVDDGTGGTNAGDINITVLNVAGCSPTPTATPPIIGGAGTSPVPVRLITPP